MVSVTELATFRLTIRDLIADDLPDCASFASPLHLEWMAGQLERVRSGTVDYLAACLPSGVLVGKGGVDYEQIPGAGTIWSLAVREDVQSCGIGTALVRVSEQRIRARGLVRAEIKVEENNPRARRLYERLGYVAYGSAPEAWDQEKADGTTFRYETVCTCLGKDLAT